MYLNVKLNRDESICEVAQGYRYHKLRKTFGKFFRSCSELLSKFVEISLKKQNRSTEGSSKLKRSVDMTSSTLELMQVPNWTGPGFRRSKRPLLASRTRCNVLWKPQKFGNKVKIGIEVQFGSKFANGCNV